MLKTVSSITNAIGALNYKGTWDALNNVPPLASGVGTKGDYYVVSTAGSTNLDGITDWQVGDWAIFNGSTWQKIDNTDLVVSVNGQTGAVVLTAANVGATPNTAYVIAGGLLTGGGQLTGNVTVSLTSIPSGNVTGLGTMALQDSNNVSITGGSINTTAVNTVATTGNTVTFAVSSLPLIPEGYLTINLNGVAKKIPYYGV